jgi:hypothetical protein
MKKRSKQELFIQVFRVEQKVLPLIILRLYLLLLKIKNKNYKYKLQINNTPNL